MNKLIFAFLFIFNFTYNNTENKKLILREFDLMKKKLQEKHSPYSSDFIATNKKGFLIAIEGIDGAGKSTVLKLLEKKLSTSFSVVCTKEPGGTSLGTDLRAILQKPFSRSFRTEFLLFAADRAQHFEEKILPLLQTNTVVISDRMADSSLVYQGYGRGLNKHVLSTINMWAMQGHSPDYTIYVRTPIDVALNRINKRNESKTAFEQEKIDFTERLINGFDEIYANRKDVIIVDGSLSTDEIVNIIYNKLFPLLCEKISQ